MKPELDWPSIRKQVTETEQALALYVYCTGETSGMDLMYAGFEQNATNRQIECWREERFIFGNQITRQALLAKYRALEAVLVSIEAGQFTLQVEPFQVIIHQPVSKPISKSEIIMINATSPCQRTPGCPNAAGHKGRCPGQKLKALPAAKPAKPAPRETELVYAPPPRPAAKTISQPVPPPAQSQYEIRHVQGAEIVHICTSNWNVARQAIALIEQMQAV